MIKYFKLVRLPNLLMVPLTMYLLRYGIIEPMLTYGYSIDLGRNVGLQFSDQNFLILVLINVFLGAAGYVINDYFDRKIDTINKPDEVLIGKSIGRRQAMIIHSVLNAIAIILAAYLAYRLWKPTVLIMYLMITGIFWLYSTTYKKQLLIGNLIVAIGTATIPLQVAFFDVVALNRAYYALLLENNASFKLILYWMAAFGFFALLTNLIREIVKDIEDFEGDKSYGCSTLPIYFGVKVSKIVVAILSISTVVLLGIVYHRFLGDYISKIYLSVFVAIPLIGVAIFVFLSELPKHYHRLSWGIKIIMLMGILYALVAKYIMVYLY